MQSKYRKIGGLLMWVLKGCLVLFCQKKKKKKKEDREERKVVVRFATFASFFLGLVNDMVH